MAPKPWWFRTTSHSCRCRRAHPNSTARKTSAVHASELVVKPDFQILRRYRQPLLLRLEHTHRPTLEDYVHRATRLGSSRSLNLRIGIIPKLADADSCCVRPSETSNCRNARKYNGISAPCPNADDGAHESTSPQASIIPILRLSDLRLPNRGGRWT